MVGHSANRVNDKKFGIVYIFSRSPAAISDISRFSGGFGSVCDGGIDDGAVVYAQLTWRLSALIRCLGMFRHFIPRSSEVVPKTPVIFDCFEIFQARG